MLKRQNYDITPALEVISGAENLSDVRSRIDTLVKPESTAEELAPVVGALARHAVILSIVDHILEDPTELAAVEQRSYQFRGVDSDGVYKKEFWNIGLLLQGPDDPLHKNWDVIFHYWPKGEEIDEPPHGHANQIGAVTLGEFSDIIHTRCEEDTPGAERMYEYAGLAPDAKSQEVYLRNMGRRVIQPGGIHAIRPEDIHTVVPPQDSELVTLIMRSKRALPLGSYFRDKPDQPFLLKTEPIDVESFLRRFRETYAEPENYPISSDEK